VVVAFHLGVFQGIISFLEEALWLKSIEEANDISKGKQDMIDKYFAMIMTQETLTLER
jgi:hypothetical protein